MTDEQSLMRRVLAKMAATCETFEDGTGFYRSLRQSNLYQGHPNKDTDDAFQRVLKSKRTLENRLNKMRIEMEVMATELHETIAIYQRRVQGQPPKAEQPKVSKTGREVLTAWRRDRVRERCDGYTEVTGEQVALSRIVRCVKVYCDETNLAHLSSQDIQAFCDDVFGGESHTLTNKTTGETKQARVYYHLRVFQEAEDVQQFDMDHQELPEIDDDIPS